MDKSQKQVTAYQLKKEKKAVNDLKEAYEDAIDQIEQEIQRLMGPGYELTQSKVYQIAYQKQMKAQLEVILDKMNANNYQTINEYINGCYEDGWLGAFYNIKGQGIPIVAPINQDAVLKAVSLDSKLSKPLYEQMGINVNELKKSIAGELSRGLASGQRYEDISRNIANQMGIGLNKAIRIARTEGHRVTCQATMDAMNKAKDAGADVVKQWDSTMDRKTRASHQRVDGEIRELDEKFSNGLMHPGDPAGKAAEVVNCRCVLLERARWALDEAELEELKQRAEYFGIDKTKNYEDFKQKYMKVEEQLKYKEMTIEEYKSWQESKDTRTQMLNDLLDEYGDVIPSDVREEILKNYKTGYSIQRDLEGVVVREWSPGQPEINLYELWEEKILKESGAINYYIQKADYSALINSYWRNGGTMDDKSIREYATEYVKNNWQGSKNAKQMQEAIDRYYKVIKEGSESLEFLTKYGIIDEDIVCDRWAGANALEYLGVDIGDAEIKRIGHAFCSENIDLVDINSQIQNLKGLIITDDGYMSVSVNSDLNVFKGSDIKYKILIPKGSTAYVSDNVNESELVFPKGTKLEIIDSKIIESEAEEWETKYKRKTIEIIVKLVTE